MSSAPIGIVAGLQAKREAVVGRLSPAARHQAFPRLYARPLPPPSNADQTAINRLQSEKEGLIKENVLLRKAIANLQAQLTTSSVLIAQKIAERKNDPTVIIAAFLEGINAQRGEDAEKWTVDHLTSSRRNRTYTVPRHVCMWLVRHLCTQFSLPKIGWFFGKRDHTSVMHACARAPHWFLTEPKMKLVADAVLLRFGGNTSESNP